MVPGIVVVWSDGRPRLAAHRIPDGGLALGRTLIPDDPDLAVQAVIDLGPTASAMGAGLGRQLIVRPQGDALVELGGKRLTEVKHLSGANLPGFLAVGRSVIALVDDVQPFENLTVVRDGTLVIGSGLASIIHEIDHATNAEEHVSLKGPDRIVHVLARRYADKLGAHAWFRPSGDQHLDHFLATRNPVRTIVLELTRPLFELDITAITNLLETDLRFVVVRRDDHFVKWLPAALLGQTLEIPRPSFDELAVEIFEQAAVVKPGAKLGASVVAALLDQAERIDEPRWAQLLALTLESWDGSDRLRVGEILRHLP